MTTDPHDPAYYCDEIVRQLHRTWPEPLVCDADVRSRMGDDSRVVASSLTGDRWRLALAAAPEGGDT